MQQPCVIDLINGATAGAAWEAPAADATSALQWHHSPPLTITLLYLVAAQPPQQVGPHL